MKLIEFSSMGDDEVGFYSLVGCARSMNHPWCVAGLMGLLFSGAYMSAKTLGGRFRLSEASKRQIAESGR